MNHNQTFQVDDRVIDSNDKAGTVRGTGIVLDIEWADGQTSWSVETPTNLRLAYPPLLRKAFFAWGDRLADTPVEPHEITDIDGHRTLVLNLLRPTPDTELVDLIAHYAVHFAVDGITAVAFNLNGERITLPGGRDMVLAGDLAEQQRDTIDVKLTRDQDGWIASAYKLRGETKPTRSEALENLADAMIAHNALPVICRAVYKLALLTARHTPAGAGLIYLASPYSHADPDVMEDRFKLVCFAAARLMADGQLVFSPIAHTHPLAKCGGLPRGWEKYGLVMIACCDKMIVLRLPGWDKSKGVAAEIAIAHTLGIPVDYIDPE